MRTEIRVSGDFTVIGGCWENAGKTKHAAMAAATRVFFMGP
jgi:hypothetical protein